MTTVVSLERNRTVVYSLFDEVFNRGNMKVLDDICNSKFVLESPEMTRKQNIQEGLTVFKERIKSLRAAFPNLKYTINDSVTSENKVAISSSFSGIQKGEFAGIAPTNKQINAYELYFIHLNDSKIERIRLSPFGPNVIQLLSA